MTEHRGTPDRPSAASLEDVLASTPGARDGLEGSSILSPLPPEQRTQVIERMSVRTLQPKEVLFHPASHDETGVHVVLAGRLNVYTVSDGARGALLAVLRPGEPLGEYRAIAGTPGNVEAADATVTAVLPREAFLHLLETFPELGLRLMRRLIATVRGQSDRIDGVHELGGKLERYRMELLRARI